MQLRRGQQWAVGALVMAILIFANIYFVEGQVQTFGFIALSIGFAIFAVLMAGNGSGRERDRNRDRS